MVVSRMCECANRSNVRKLTAYDSVNSAAKTMMKLMIKSQLSGAMGTGGGAAAAGGSSGGLGQLLGMASK